MGRTKKKVALTLTTALITGFLGFGNYALNDNKDLTETSKTFPVSDAGEYQQQQGPGWQKPDSSADLMKEQEGGTCVSVHDGDTITVRLAKSPHRLLKVRLIGIDTPELRIGEFGQTARDFTQSLLLGQAVRLVYDRVRYDKYGRSLAYVYLQDRTFVNARLLEEGCGRVMTIPPNNVHAAEFKLLQDQAQEQQVGIWAQPPPKCTWRGETVVKEWIF
jgi:micrococcal nuclease